MTLGGEVLEEALDKTRSEKGRGSRSRSRRRVPMKSVAETLGGFCSNLRALLRLWTSHVQGRV